MDVLKAKAETIKARITALTENPFGDPQAIRDLFGDIRSMEMTLAGLRDTECRVGLNLSYGLILQRYVDHAAFLFVV